jgi:hypothetical protein
VEGNRRAGARLKFIREAAPPAAQTAVDPCGLITRDDAAQLLGEPMLEGERREEGRVGMTLCLYNPADPDRGSSLTALRPKATSPPGGVAGITGYHGRATRAAARLRPTPIRSKRQLR